MVVTVVVGWVLVSTLIIAAWGRLNASRAWRCGALLVTVACSLAHQLMFGTTAEDAYITFRYSLNLAEGHGPVFNIGERVEGYSNFLWMVLISWPKVLFGADIVTAAAVLGVLCVLGCVVLAYLLANRIVRLAKGAQDTPALGVLAALVTAGVGSLAAYGPSGLETPLFLLLVLGVCHALATQHPVVAGVLVALATMTRPDGLVVAVVAGGWLVGAAWRGRSSWWAPAGFALAGLVFAVPWTAWRLTYYGYFLPNAVAAKAGGSLGWQLQQGWQYLAGFALVYQAFLLLAFGMVGALLLRRRSVGEPMIQARWLVWLVFAIALAYTAFVTWAGGDWMPAWRLLAPTPPLIAVGIVAGYGVLAASATPSAAAPHTRPRPSPSSDRRLDTALAPVMAAALCGLSLLVSVTHSSMLASMHHWRDDIAEMEEIGSWLGQRLPSGTVVSTYANGALSYRAGPGLTMIDVLGLTDEHISRNGQRHDDGAMTGHIASDYGYVTQVRRPALVVTTGNGYSGEQLCAPDPTYGPRYRPATFRRVDSPHWITVYPRVERAEDIIPRLDADPRFRYVPCPQ